MKNLKKGDTIGILSPSSALKDEKWEQAIKNIENLGYHVKISQHARNKWGYLSGTDEEKVSDLHAMFSDPDVDAIICVRGGYGTVRYLRMLDYELIKRNEKIFVGYSDLTALIHAMYVKSGMIGFHGPMAASEYPDFVVDLFEKTFEKAESEITLKSENGVVYHNGKAKGELMGGNLAVFVSLLGSKIFPVDTKGKILFFEDVSEEPYRIDRFLSQLYNGGYLDDAAGLVLGYFTDCDSSDEDSFTIDEVLKDRLALLNIPVMSGFPIGHVANNAYIPYGAMAVLDTQSATLNFENPLAGF